MIPNQEVTLQPTRICQASMCQNDASLVTIIHIHSMYEKCNPHDLDSHHIYKLCKIHNRLLVKRGESRLMLKDEYYV